ncbi:MAG: hypothetical protein ACRCYP_04895 [Alphaproteobacteria bacterium]
MKKLIVASVLIFSLSAGSAIAVPTHTLIPEFTPGQHIYLDPSIQNHPTAPFAFSAPFKDRVDASNVYVVASQKGDEAIPEGKKLGVAKVDELIAKWAGNAQFNKQDYIAIFWVRRADDTSKGSVGANVGSVQRNNGITPSALNEIVSASLKANMPQDPEGAIADIATTIETEIVGYKQEQLRAEEQKKREAEAAAARRVKEEAFFKSVNELGNNVIKGLLVISPFGIIGAWVARSRKRRRELEAKANSLIAQWEKVLNNAGTFYTELTEKYLGELEVLDLDKCDETFQMACQKAIGEVAFFMDMKQQGDLVLESANIDIGENDLKNAVHLLTKNEIQVTGDKVPLAAASLLTGPNRVTACKAAEFLGQLEKQFKTAKDDLIFILDQYNSVDKVLSQMTHDLKMTMEYLLEKNYTENSFFNLNGIEIKKPLDNIGEGPRLCALAKQCAEEYNITGLAIAKDEFKRWATNIVMLENDAVEAYMDCEKGLRSLPSFESMRDKYNLARQVFHTIQRKFPSYYLGDKFVQLSENEVELKKYAEAWPRMKSLYEQADFEALLGLIHIYQSMCDRISADLNSIIHRVHVKVAKK